MALLGSFIDAISLLLSVLQLLWRSVGAHAASLHAALYIISVSFGTPLGSNCWQAVLSHPLQEGALEALSARVARHWTPMSRMRVTDLL